MSHANPIPFHRPYWPCTGHTRPTNPMPIPSKKYLRFMLYISSIFLFTSPLSVGHPAPPFTPLVRPRTAVCSRGARARRERSGSVAEADGYSGAHRAAAPHASTSATHTAHAAGELATSSHSPPDAHPSPPAVPFHVEHGGVLPPLHSRRPCTPCRAMLHYAREPAALHSRRPCTPCCAPLHYAREPAALHSRHPCTPRCAPLHYAPPKLPFTQPGCPALKSRQPSRGQCA